MIAQLDRIIAFGRTITVELPEIAHETDSGILIEWNGQNGWLPKSKVRIAHSDDSVMITVPRWLFERKF